MATSVAKLFGRDDDSEDDSDGLKQSRGYLPTSKP